MSRPSRILSAPGIGRALAEIAIIVLGVLIALGADAWWTEREEAELADGYRAALLADLIADSVLYDVLVDRGWFQVQAEAVDSLLAFVADPSSERDPVTLAQWLLASTRVSVGSKTAATFDDLRSSGRLSLLGDPEVRRALIAYHSLPIVRDELAYATILDGSLDQGSRLRARLLGAARLLDFDRCYSAAADAHGDPPLESPLIRTCLETRGGFAGFDLSSRIHAEPELLENLSVLVWMREAGLAGATAAKEEAVALRAMLRGNDSDAAASDTLRVLAYNIHHGEGMDSVIDLQRIADLILEVDADVVTLQEVDSVVTRTNGVDQAAELGRLTGMTPVFGRFMPYQGGAYGMALLSRLPIRSSENHRLPDGTEPRTALEAVVTTTSGRDVRVVGIHFYRTEEERAAQADSLDARLIRGPDAALPTILAGDFNSEPGGRVMNDRAARWTIVDKGEDRLTFASYDPAREIDFHLFRPAEALRVLSQRVLNEPVISDHQPIVVDFEIRP